MSIIRSYFEKNNTIVYNSDGNTAKNPVAELFYGNENGEFYSRFLLKIDLRDLQQKVDSSEILITSGTTHFLKLKNTSFFDRDELGKFFGGKLRATSFDLYCYAVNQFWDEGIGYDYKALPKVFNDDYSFSTEASNWFSATTLNTWTVPGSFSGSPVPIATQHFDNGNEDLNLDITEYINSIIISGETDNGLVIAFGPDYESQASSLDRSLFVGFFTKYTQTFFEPFLETKFSYDVFDDRNRFLANKTNRLYFYSQQFNEPKNIDNLDNVIVQIKDTCGDTIQTIYGTTGITNPTIGVYYIETNIQTNEYMVQYSDIWSGITIDGIAWPETELNFTIQPATNGYLLGDSPFKPEQYSYNIYGLSHNETLNSDDKRKVFVEVKKKFNKNIPIVLDQVYYRIHIRQGNNEIEIIPYTKLYRDSYNNFFILDSSWFLPGIYYISIMYKSANEIRYNKDIIKFIKANENSSVIK